MTPSSTAKLTRRTMLKAAVAAGGGLVLGVSRAAGRSRGHARRRRRPTGDFAPNAFIRIDTDGTVTLIMPQVEMGQGVYTALAMILAEELDAPFEQCPAEAAPPNDKLYGNPLLGVQATGNSTRFAPSGNRCARPAPARGPCWSPAAAGEWSVDPASCRTQNGEVIHDASKRKARLWRARRRPRPR